MIQDFGADGDMLIGQRNVVFLSHNIYGNNEPKVDDTLKAICAHGLHTIVRIMLYFKIINLLCIQAVLDACLKYPFMCLNNKLI